MISLDASTLHDALKIVKPAVSPRAQLPVLSGVKLHADGGVLDVTATDLDLTIATSMPCTKHPFDVVVPAVQFTDFISHADDVVKLSVKDANLIAESPKARLELRTLNLDDWPRLTVPVGEPVVLSPEALALIGRILHAAETDRNAKQAYRGVQLRGTRAVTTDKYRMAIAELGVEVPDLLLPAAAISVIVNECDGPIELTADARQCRVTNLATSWTFRLIEDSFPEIGRLIRAESPTAIDVDREALKDALTVASISGDSKLVRLQPQSDELLVSAEGPDVGRSEYRIATVANFDGEVGFNAGFLRDALTALTTERVTIGLDGAMKPAQFEDGPILLLVVPKQIH